REQHRNARRRHRHELRLAGELRGERDRRAPYAASARHRHGAGLRSDQVPAVALVSRSSIDPPTHMTITSCRALPRAVIATALLAASCADAPRGLLSGAPAPPPEIEQACTLATTKCARCHSIDRVIVSRGIGVGRWQ